MAGQICIGPEFSAGTDGKLHLKGAGSKAWPTVAGASADVFGQNNGLSFDATNGGLYTAPHGCYRWSQHVPFSGPDQLNRGINTPLAVGTTWTNGTIAAPLAISNPSLNTPMALMWWVTFSIQVSFPSAFQLAHLVAADMKKVAQADCITAGTAANSPISHYDMTSIPWSDSRQLCGWSTVPPGDTVGLWAAQVLTTAAWGLSAEAPGGGTQFAVVAAAVDFTAEGILIDANQAGGVW